MTKIYKQTDKRLDKEFTNMDTQAQSLMAELSKGIKTSIDFRNADEAGKITITTLTFGKYGQLINVKVKEV